MTAAKQKKGKTRKRLAKWFSRRQDRFLPHSVILEEAGSPGLLRVAIATIGVAVVAFLVWAANAKVEEAAISFGEVIPSGSIQSVQHL